MSAPDLPRELLEKIGGIAKIVSPGEISEMPEAEPHCNCVHCQLMRAIHGKERTEEPEAEEDDELGRVSEEELRFCDWDVVQASDNVFTVSHRLEPQQSYTVFLGDEVGCNCGEPHCAHVKAALESDL